MTVSGERTGADMSRRARAHFSTGAREPFSSFFASMTLSRAHSLDDGSTEVMEPSDDLLDDLDDFLQWIKAPSDGDNHHSVSRFDPSCAEGVSVLGTLKNAEQSAEHVDENLELAVLRDMDIAESSFFSTSQLAYAPAPTTLDPSRPHVCSANTFVDLLAAPDSPHSNSSSAAVTPVRDDDSQGSTPTPAAPAKKKRDQNRSRKRQREELLHLRVIANELESELHQLLTVQDSSARTNASSSLSTSDELVSSSLTIASHRREQLQHALFWKRAASNEKQQVDFARMENTRLRSLIEENVLVCDSAREVWDTHPAVKLTVRSVSVFAESDSMYCS